MRAPRPDEYPFGRADGSFFLGGAEAGPLPSGPPLLAYGANASPARLAAKLGPGARAAALAARLHDFEVVHSAHVSPYGAVPATIVPAPGRVADVHVLLVDGDGRGALDATEPNYDRVLLDGVRLEAERLGAVDAVEAYVSRWGALRIGGRTVPLGSLPQRALLARLRREDARGGV
jgi:hypothetical protein